METSPIVSDWTSIIFNTFTYLLNPYVNILLIM